VTFRRPLAAATLLAAPMVAVPAAPATAARSHDRLEAAIVHEINVVRGQQGLRALRLSPRLARVADRHSGDQARAGRIAHTSTGGASAVRRLRGATRARAVGETLAFLPGAAAARDVVRLWLASPGHRAALLSRSYRRVGVAQRAAWVGGSAGTVVTANFAGLR